MPLLDHFHAPLYPRRSWESFHARWATALGNHLNETLPRRYRADVLLRLGPQAGADVAEWEPVESEDAGPTTNGAAHAVAAVWAPPQATATIPLTFPDELAVEVVDEADGERLVGVLELVSPSNKDRPETRASFAGKCAAYLHRGVGVVVVDVVTSRQANLHDELIRLLDGPDAALLPAGTAIAAVGYRATRSPDAGQGRAEIWAHPLTVGEVLPVVPLALRGGGVYPVDLEETYALACRWDRLG